MSLRVHLGMNWEKKFLLTRWKALYQIVDDAKLEKGSEGLDCCVKGLKQKT